MTGVSFRQNPTRWMRENLFSSLQNSVLTVLVALLLLAIVPGFFNWVFFHAKWAVVPANFRLLMVGPYPQPELWRPWVGVLAVAILAGFQWGQSKTRNMAAFVVLGLVAVFALVTQFGNPSGWLVPLACVLVVVGYAAGQALSVSGRAQMLSWVVLFFGFLILIGTDFGRGPVPSNLWGGLLLTALLALVATVLSFPLGVMLAVGRSSSYPIISGLCITFIEAVRGVPLVAVLFMAQLFVPLFLPDFQIDKVIRAMIGMTLFSAAYLAENVRGGLQSVPKGQVEAAKALGLSNTETLVRIVLPQALRTVIPAIVGQFIALFKDTSLVAIIGLTDLTGIGYSITANPNWIGLQKEIYLTIAVIYFVFSSAMSNASRTLEKRLNTSR